jgi:hypothetical protein
MLKIPKTLEQFLLQYLSDVIGYVRLLLVDSKVFAEEIEPTGAVPMELSLERYVCGIIS